MARNKGEYLVCSHCSNRNCLIKRREQQGESVYWCSICRIEFFDSEVIRKTYEVGKFTDPESGETKWVHYNEDRRIRDLIKANALKGTRDDKSQNKKYTRLSRRENTLLRKLKKQ